VQIRLLALRTLQYDPLLGTVLQQRTPIEIDRLLQPTLIGLCQGGVKGDQVAERIREIEGKGAWRRCMEAIGSNAQRVAHVVQTLTEADKSVLFGGVRPECARQPRAIDRGSPFEDQQREQPLPFPRPQRGHRRALYLYIEHPEKSDFQR